MARGDVSIVRYADDLVMGFQHRAEAVRFLEEFKERLAKFGLELYPGMTRLIEFGASQRGRMADCGFHPHCGLVALWIRLIAQVTKVAWVVAQTGAENEDSAPNCFRHIPRRLASICKGKDRRAGLEQLCQNTRYTKSQTSRQLRTSPQRWSALMPGCSNFR